MYNSRNVCTYMKILLLPRRMCRHKSEEREEKKSEIDPRRVLRTQITDHRNFMDIDDSNNSSNNNGGDLSK